MTDENIKSVDNSSEETFLDPATMDIQWHEYSEKFEDLLNDGLDSELIELVTDISPGDLSEIVRPLSVDDTVKLISLLPRELASDVLAEIDKRSASAFVTLLDVEEIADIVEEMPSDEATDFLGELEDEKAREILAAMEPEERQEVTELLKYEPDSAGGLMAKEFLAVTETADCLTAVNALKELDPVDLDEIHYIYTIDEAGKLLGRIRLVEMLMKPWSTPVAEAMERDPHCVEADLDQEMVAQFVKTHDLVTLPVVDHNGVLLGVISADDVLDVIEEEATEDYSRLAGTSVDELGETSPLRIARSRLPWLLAALVGQVGCVFMMKSFEAGLAATVALTFFIPAIMAMGGNTGIQTSSVVVRGLATGEVDVFHIGKYLLRELGTALITGGVIALCMYFVALFIVGNSQLALVLTISMLSVVIFAALVGTSIPLILHRIGIDPAIATGPFITTSNDIAAILIYLTMASMLLSEGVGT